MRQYRSLILILIFLLAITVFTASCGKPEETETSLPNVTTAPESSTAQSTTVPVTSTTTTTTVPVTETTAPETTEEPATPGLTYESTGDGFCYVSGCLDDSAKRIVIPTKNSSGEYVLGIKNMAFFSKTNIEEVVFPADMDSIGIMAFYGCTALRRVTFTDGLLNIAAGAFQACTALEEVHLPASLTNLATTSFYGCTKLKTLTVAEGNKYFRSEKNCIIDVELDKVYLGCIGSTIPASVNVIGEYAFYYMGLTSFVIPDHVTVVEKHAFAGNDQLKAVTLSESLREIGDMAFANCSALESITLPKNLESIGKRVFQNCNALTTLNVSAENTVFSGEGLCIVEKASGVLVQGFRMSNPPMGVRTVGEGAFFSSLISKLVLPEGVETVEPAAFSNCNALRELTIPASVTVMAANVFERCAVLEKITFGGTQREWNILTALVELPENVVVTCLGDTEAT